jgi:phosphonopyruvate decarboxylase
MINTETVGKYLQTNGYGFFAGVPCSYLKPLINYAESNCYYVASSNEGDAVASAVGATIAGKKSVVMFQNSGLGNAVSPLSSLAHLFQVPILGFVSLRGDPDFSDAPQHELMGIITEDLLTKLQIAWEYLADNITDFQTQFQRANKILSEKKSFFFIVKKNQLTEYHSQQLEEKKAITPVVLLKSKEDTFPKRKEVLALLSDKRENSDCLLSATGYTSRELYGLDDHNQNFYMMGSMGCLSSLSLGFALAKPEKRFIAIDGDGALLMRLGAMAALAYYRPKNVLHIVLNNGIHESTGGQYSTAKEIDFVKLASSLPYDHCQHIHSLSELEVAQAHWQANPRLSFFQINTSLGVMENLQRPSLTPYMLAERFSQGLS